MKEYIYDHRDVTEFLRFQRHKPQIRKYSKFDYINNKSIVVDEERKRYLKYGKGLIFQK